MLRAARHLLLLFLVGSQVLWSAGASAQEEPAFDREEVARQRKSLQSKYPPSRRVSRYLKTAAEKADDGEPDEARELLEKLGSARLNPHERAMVYRLTAHIAYGSGNYDEAVESFEKVLAEEVMSVETDDRIRYNIAQIHASQQNWQGTVDAIHRWLRYIDEPDPSGYYLLGIANYQLESFDAALEAAQTAVDLSPDPKEPWLHLLAALFVQRRDFASAAPVFEELVIRFPKKQYWTQLSLIYGAREDYRSSLAAQQVSYAQGFLTEDKEVRRLARGYLYHSLPFPAASVLEEALERGYIEEDAEFYELLANSWVQAREYERSIPYLEKAASLSENGNLYVRLGQVRLQREQWEKAARALANAHDRGGLKDPGNARLLLGIALYNDGKLEQARRAFRVASDYDSTRDKANAWIRHLEEETAAN